jgi:hypothetical protein
VIATARASLPAQHPALPNGDERKKLKIPSVVAPPHGSHRSITLNRTVLEDFRVWGSGGQLPQERGCLTIAEAVVSLELMIGGRNLLWSA